MSERFAARAQALRDTWIERRQMKTLASSHDFSSQFELLATLHRWSLDLAEDVARVYGDTLRVEITRPPEATSSPPAFSLVIGDSSGVTFTLTERRRPGDSRWFVAVVVASPGSGGGVAAAGPERRNGQWNRSRLEDLLLSVLGAHERSLPVEPWPG